MKRDANKERCVECLRVPCRCAEYPGMKVLDSELIDMAATCSNRGLRLNAELVLRQRWPGRRQRLSFHKGEIKMRATLEQLKAMSDEMLDAVWADFEFPFDGMRGCGECITWHHKNAKSKCRHLHQRIAVQVSALGPIPQRKWWRSALSIPAEWLRRNLEEIYALRLFYDSLYPQTEAAPHAEEKTIAESAPSLVAQGLYLTPKGIGHD